MLKKFALGWVLLAAVIPLAVRAGHAHRMYGRCGHCFRLFAACGCPQPICGGCNLPPLNCCCPPPPVVQTQLVPQTTTILCPQQVTTLESVTCTQIRRESQVVDVPVTTCRQVTVDEGGYQTVWVPKLVTKTVPQTTIQKQVQYRDVPYQVVQQVPRVHTQMVPQQVTTLVPQTTIIGPPNCGPAGVMGPPVMAPPSVMPSPVMPVPAVQPGVPVPSSSMLSPVPQPYPLPSAELSRPETAIANGQVEPSEAPRWTRVSRRDAEAGEIQQQSYEQVVYEAAPRGQFLSPPTAAAVWKAQAAFGGR